MYSNLIHWFERQRFYMAFPSRHDTVRIAQTRRANAGSAQTVRKLCANCAWIRRASSCQCGHSWARIRVLNYA